MAYDLLSPHQANHPRKLEIADLCMLISHLEAGLIQIHNHGLAANVDDIGLVEFTLRDGSTWQQHGRSTNFFF